MLIKQVHQKSVIFVTIGILNILVLSMNRIFNLMRKAMSFNHVKGSAYRINFWYMSKDDAINKMNGSNLVDKMGVL